MHLGYSEFLSDGYSISPIEVDQLTTKLAYTGPCLAEETYNVNSVDRKELDGTERPCELGSWDIWA